VSARSRSAALRLERSAEYLERALAWLLVLLMVAMVADVSWQVVSRFLLHAPSSFTEELAGFLLIWIVTDTAKRAADILAHALVLLFALTVMVVGGLRLVQLAFQLNQISAVMGLRMGYVYLAVPLAGLLMVVFSLESIATVATRRAER
jgi:TRAP-type C4-dicarboxylate transport system permease small subunit